MRSPESVKKRLKKLNIAEVSRLTGISRQTLYNFINGDNVRITTLRLIDSTIKNIEAKNGR